MVKKNHNDDFEHFMAVDDVSPPENLADVVYQRIVKELTPSHPKVFLKLFGIQAFIGMLTMLFCPQFKFSLTNSYALFHFFHRVFGSFVCMSLCGAIFVGSGAMFASMILSGPDVCKIRKSIVIYYLGLSLMFTLSFAIMGAQVYVGIGIAWIIGAVIAGLLSFELGHLCKQRVWLT